MEGFFLGEILDEGSWCWCWCLVFGVGVGVGNNALGQ
jgi:hypothetical protein